ncbi:ectoine synthase [Pseudomonas sp. CBSPBW29]|nr:ectoine synthase [Pseudomonas sp. CBSPBW29]
MGRRHQPSAADGKGRDGLYRLPHRRARRTESLLQYRNHLEACYCIAGEGEVEDMDGNVYPIRPGDIYALDQHDCHYLRGGKDQDLVLVSVFNPPLKGDERHNLTDTSGSGY